MKKRGFFPSLFFFQTGRGQNHSESAILSHQASTQMSAILAQYEKQTEESDQVPDPRFAVRLVLSWPVYLTLSL